jgi:DNA-binding beta-propeller fold protein YncE
MGWKLETPRIALRYWLAPAAGFAAALALALSAAYAYSAPLLEPKLIVTGFESDSHFNHPRGIAFDPGDGAVYVANKDDHRIEAFSKAGHPLTRFVHTVTHTDGAAVDGEPSALAFDRAGRLLVVDNEARYVDVIDRRGRPVTRLGIPAGHPVAVTVARDGTIYVGVTGEETKVYFFHADYSRAGSWGDPGTEPGRLNGVTALAELADGNIAVACARTQLGIQVFTPAGAYVRGFAPHEMGPGNISLPSGVVSSADGRIWVSDEIRESIQVFDRDGTFVAQAGGPGSGPGDFMYPSSLAVDGKGLMAVTERGGGRFQVLNISKGEEVSAGNPE